MLLRVLVIVSLLLSALGLGTLGFYAFAPAAPPPIAEVVPPPPPARPRVLAAARALPAGTLLKDEDLVVREIAPDAISTDVATEVTRGELRGGLLRRYLDAGAPVPLAEALRPRARGFLAAGLRGGRRAISVGVDVVTGTAGLIWPGDQVDLILTQELAEADAPLGRRVIGETVLSDLRVIAVDQQLTQGAVGDTAQGRVARTVTLEVTATEAERVAVAGRLGRIALTVRAIEPPGETVPAGVPVFGADVSPALAGSTVSQGTRMRVIQGDDKQEVVFR